MPETIYDQIGGEQPLRQLVDRFYQIMHDAPEAWEVRNMHPEDLSGSADKLFKFLSGWTGGPPLYMQEFGHPRLRRRHMHVAIGKRERDQWMFCMDQAMEDSGLDPQLRRDLYQALFNTADFMRNKADSSEELMEDQGAGLVRLQTTTSA